ncbi:MAG: catalase-peroxidase, partial [candidate division WOR-3 bacterium]|nr:catalase-peroxidase [candidate division WOR-3 bacterium]
TSDLALRFDPAYAQIAKRFLENPEEFEKVFARAWFKLVHRDLGPKECYLGPEIPKDTFVWQDPLPERDYNLIDESDVEELKKAIMSSGLSIPQMVYTAWSSAVTYRNSDRRGGANGARIRLEPQRNWEVNHPEGLIRILSVYEKIKNDFDALHRRENKKISIADLIVLAGCAGIEEASRKAGFELKVPFIPGRVDALQEQVDIEFTSAMEPFACGFRNYIKDPSKIRAEEMLIDKAQLLTLTVPELVVIVAGLRVLGATYKYEPLGVFTHSPGTLTNDFLVNLLDMSTEWKPVDQFGYLYYGYDRKTGTLKWKATRVDLIFGHHEELRAVCEVYGASDGKEKFVQDFITAWNKVMNLDRFDLKNKK